MKKEHLVLGVIVATLLLEGCAQAQNNDTSEADIGSISEDVSNQIQTSSIEEEYDKEIYPYGIPVDEEENELTNIKEIMEYNVAHGAPDEIPEDAFIGETIEEQARIAAYNMNYTGSYMDADNMKALFEDMDGQCKFLDPWSFDSNLFARAATKYLDEAKAFYNILCSQKIISAQFKVLVDAADWCEVEIHSAYDLKRLFFKLAKEPEKYFAEQSLTVKREWDKKDKKNYFVVRFNNLNVDNWPIKEGASFSINLLRKFCERNYINSLDIEGQEVSFRFASPSIKKLLTTAGEILELFTYYEVLKTGYFDDIACGYEFQWERGDVMNELDGLLTKGFKTIFIECKARSSLDQNFYHKLLSIANQFGIAAIKVMIANTYENYETINEINETMVERGSQMDIITIRKPEDIKNIGKTLINIIEGK